MNIHLLVVGNPNDIKCWSGTPYFILQALQAQGVSVKAHDTSYSKNNLFRLLWVLGRVFTFRRPHGFQYSSLYERRFIAPKLTGLKAEDVVLSLNTHIPSKNLIKELNLKVVHYDDSTVEQIVRDPHYYWSSLTTKDQWIFQKESDALEHSHAVVGMTDYASDAMRKAARKETSIHTVLGGANLPEQTPNSNLQERQRGKEIHLGLIAVDPEFKGIRELIQVAEGLITLGHHPTIHLIGVNQINAKSEVTVICHGFVDKENDLTEFAKIMGVLDYGWLYPKFEAFGISVLEFYRFHIPVIGLGQFGPASTISNQLGLRIESSETMTEVSQRIHAHFTSAEYNRSLECISQIQAQISWERAARELLMICENPNRSFDHFRIMP